MIRISKSQYFYETDYVMAVRMFRGNIMGREKLEWVLCAHSEYESTLYTERVPFWEDRAITLWAKKSAKQRRKKEPFIAIFQQVPLVAT